MKSTCLFLMSVGFLIVQALHAKQESPYDEKLPKGVVARLGTARKEGRPWAVVSSPDGSQWAAATDRGVQIWETATGKVIRRLEDHRGSIRCLAYSPDATILASGDDESIVRLWDMATGKSLGEIRAHRESVDAIAFRSDPKTLVTAGGHDDRLNVWHVRRRDKIRDVQLPYKHPTHEVPPNKKLWHNGNFSHDGSRFNTCLNGSCKVIDVDTGKEIFSTPTITGFSILSPDGGTVACKTKPEELAIWNVNTGAQIGDNLRTQTGVLAFSSNGKRLAFGQHSSIEQWEIAARKPFATRDLRQGSIYRLIYSADGRALASVGADTTILILDQ